MSITAIFFDLGNVLVGLDWKKALAEIRKHTTLSPDEIGKCFENTRIDAYENGLLSSAEFFGDLKKDLSFSDSPERLERICSDIFYPLEANIAVLRKLHGNYRLAVISNTSEAHISFEEEHFDFFDVFEARIYSHQVQSRKPEPEIYDAALSAMQVGPAESLLIDDLAENVSAAKEMGWNTIHLAPGVDLRKQLQVLEIMSFIN